MIPLSLYNGNFSRQWDSDFPLFSIHFLLKLRLRSQISLKPSTRFVIATPVFKAPTACEILIR